MPGSDGRRESLDGAQPVSGVAGRSQLNRELPSSPIFQDFLNGESLNLPPGALAVVTLGINTAISRPQLLLLNTINLTTLSVSFA